MLRATNALALGCAPETHADSSERDGRVPFNSFAFVAGFLPLALLGFFFLGRYRDSRPAKVWLLAVSLAWYAVADLPQIVLLLASVALNFLAGDVLAREGVSEPRRRRMLVLAVVANVAGLAVFKYSGFAIVNLNALLGTSLAVPALGLPPGISFLTFLQIAFLVDRYRRTAPRAAPLDYALFVTFFPKIMVGPITRQQEIVPQLDTRALARPNYRDLSIGTFLLFLGLFKKVVLADALARWANAGFADSAPLTLIEAWATSLSYTFQLYFDFSGYTDMAIGIGLMFNIRIPPNFLSPYKALDLQDFWRRWHITLSRFLRDYVYIPLGGNRGGEVLTYRNLVLTFLIGGIWHGAGWTFMAWGLLHGIGVAIHRGWSSRGLRLPRAVAWFVTFQYVNFCWVFFRAPDFPSALRVLRGMLGLDGLVLHEALRGPLAELAAVGFRFGPWPSLPAPGSALLLLAGSALLVLATPNSMELSERFRFDLRHKLATIALAVTSLMSLTHVSEFVYTQF